MSDAWTIENHACRECGGRLLSRPTKSKTRVVQCSGCGISGASLRALCFCGTKLHTGKDAGLRCRMDRQHTPGIGPEVVCVQGSSPRHQHQKRRAMPVGVSGSLLDQIEDKP